MAGQDRGGNEGFSGLPLWKVQQQMAQYRSAMPINQPDFGRLSEEPPEAPNVLADGFTLGGGDPKQKPLARHVLIKDLNKIASRYKYERPKTGVFENKAPMGLYAIFDGQSSTGTPGPLAAEFCARNFHMKLLDGISQLPPEQANEAFVQAVLIKSFEDLDRDLLTTQPEVPDGCGAVVTLLIGERIFVAALGQCTAILAETGEGGVVKPTVLCKGKGDLRDPEERRRVQQAGAAIIGDGSQAMLRSPSGATSAVTRSLGDRLWKVAPSGGAGPIVACSPEVQCVSLKGADSHPFLILHTSSIGTAMSLDEIMAKAAEYDSQPRAACGDITASALAHYGEIANMPQCTTVQVCFLPPRPKAEGGEKRKAAATPETVPPLLKKARDSAPPGGMTKSVRLRHILVKFSDGAKPVKPDSKGKAPKTRQDAEALLRRAIAELKKDQRSWTKRPKDSNDLVQMSSKKFIELAREISECDSAQRGGSMCGDLGWVTPEGRAKFGVSFKDVVDVLQPGQWSDIAVSEQGLHLVQRVA